MLSKFLKLTIVFLILSIFFVDSKSVQAGCSWTLHAQCKDLGELTHGIPRWLPASNDSQCTDQQTPNRTNLCCCEVGCCRYSYTTFDSDSHTEYTTEAECEKKRNPNSLNNVFWYSNHIIEKGSKWSMGVIPYMYDYNYCVPKSNNTGNTSGGGNPTTSGGGNPTNQTTGGGDPSTTKGTPNFNYSEVTNPLQTVSVPEVVGRVIRAFLLIVGSILLIVIIAGGFMWMTAAGNPSKVAKGRNTLMWAVAGVVVIFIAWIIVGFIFEAIGI